MLVIMPSIDPAEAGLGIVPSMGCRCQVGLGIVPSMAIRKMTPAYESHLTLHYPVIMYGDR